MVKLRHLTLRTCLAKPFLSGHAEVTSKENLPFVQHTFRTSNHPQMIPERTNPFTSHQHGIQQAHRDSSPEKLMNVNCSRRPKLATWGEHQQSAISFGILISHVRIAFVHGRLMLQILADLFMTCRKKQLMSRRMLIKDLH